MDNILNTNLGLLLLFETFYCYLVTKYNGKYFLTLVLLVLQEGDYICIYVVNTHQMVLQEGDFIYIYAINTHQMVLQERDYVYI